MVFGPLLAFLGVFQLCSLCFWVIHSWFQWILPLHPGGRWSVGNLESHALTRIGPSTLSGSSRQVGVWLTPHVYQALMTRPAILFMWQLVLPRSPCGRSLAGSHLIMHYFSASRGTCQLRNTTLKLSAPPTACKPHSFLITATCLM